MRKDIFEQYIRDFCEDLSSKETTHDYNRCRHAAVLTYNNVIISSGVNVNLHHGFTKTFDAMQTLHAEPVAIMRAMKRHSKIIHKCELWVCRSNKVSHVSKPCETCERIIKSFGIKTVHYTNSEGEWETMNM